VYSDFDRHSSVKITLVDEFDFVGNTVSTVSTVRDHGPPPRSAKSPSRPLTMQTVLTQTPLSAKALQMEVATFRFLEGSVEVYLVHRPIGGWRGLIVGAIGSVHNLSHI
jgi:hypothetical protein